jgi:predicted SprT family Zn-dependent metalloprotease
MQFSRQTQKPMSLTLLDQHPLLKFFEETNLAHFDGFLDAPVLRWNSRLRSSAGRFVPGSRKYFKQLPPAIEIASYLLDESNAEALIRDTMAHEMIHYWLWVRKKPYGHTSEFLEKMRSMGVSRYNPVPRTRPYRYVYACEACQREFPARKKLGVLACAHCCKKHSQGKYDARFKLVLARSLTVQAD